MDAKSKAGFINSIAGAINTAAQDGSILCPKCGAANDSGSTKCLSCGEELAPARKAEPAFLPHVEEPKPAERRVKYVEPENVFADGLPAWSLEPPQTVVRRH